MKVMDYFIMSSLNLLRDKKKIGYVFVTLICVFLSFGILIFKHNFELLFSSTISKEIGFRTINTLPIIEDYDSAELQYNMDEDINKLLNIKHVIDAFSSNYREVILSDTSLKTKNLDGTITLRRGTVNTFPKVVSGRKINDLETGVAICPTSFYPNLNPQYIDNKYVISGDDILGKKITVSYNNYKLNATTLNQEKNETFSKVFKIVGLYDTSQYMNDNGVCYVSKNDVIDIIDTTETILTDSSISIAQSINGIRVIVDDVSNVNYVIKQMKKLGFERETIDYKIDENMINTIRISVAFIISLTIFIIFILTSGYIKKKINKEEKIIGILRTSGYSKRNIKMIFAIETFLKNLIIYLIGVISFLIVYFITIQKNKFLVGISFLIGGLKIDIYSFVFSFIITVLIPSLITIFLAEKKCALKIVDLIGNEE